MSPTQACSSGRAAVGPAPARAASERGGSSPVGSGAGRGAGGGVGGAGVGRVDEVEEAVEAELADADFQLLGGLQAGDVLRQDLGLVDLQPVDVPGAGQACSAQEQGD